MILDYSTSINDSELDTPYDHKSPKDITRFGIVGTCPFCSTILTEVHCDEDEMRASTAYEIGIYVYAHQCMSCGWWKTYKHDWKNDSAQYYDEYTIIYATLRRYSAEDHKLPIDTLRSYLIQNPNFLNQVDSYKTEKLVGSVFADFYECEVKHVGKSGDGGIDLFLVLSDKNILVQVKNRRYQSKNWKSEPVKTVREFLGATIIKQHAHSILVSTAINFSKGAIQTASEIVEKRILSQYDLINGQQFLDMLNVTTDTFPDHWRNHLWKTHVFSNSVWAKLPPPY